jgi:hypothetical protein
MRRAIAPSCVASNIKIEVGNMKQIEEMESQLPIPVYPTKDLASYLSQSGKEITVDTELMITKVFDSGYEGGIICLLDGINPESFVISITGEAGPSSVR